MEIVQRTEFALTDEALIEGLWSVYDGAFANMRECIQDQRCYDEASFKDAMRDAEYAKFIIQDDTGRVLGYELATANLKKASVAYVNPYRLAAMFPSEAASGRLWYITSLAVTPDAQGHDLSAPIVELITQFAVSRNIVFAYDFATDKMPQFPDYVMHQVRKAIKKHGLPVTKSETRLLGGQGYCAIILTTDPDPKE